MSSIQWPTFFACTDVVIPNWLHFIRFSIQFTGTFYTLGWGEMRWSLLLLLFLFDIDCFPYSLHRRAVNQRSPTESTSSFRRSLLNAILDVLQITPCAVSSGAIHWLFKLLAGFAAQADSTLTSFVCLELLEFLSSKLASSRLREHQLLRARLESLFIVEV